MNTDKSLDLSLEQRNELNDIAFKIIGAGYQVSNTLGMGFLEKVYENALCWEIRKAGLERSLLEAPRSAPYALCFR